MTNKIHIIYLFICTQSALHISGEVFAGAMDEMEFRSISSMTPADNNIGGLY